jgi:2-polyprenyl-3-methyl-5-hydroxy-6-metoxy-1,4-benzoquinol methylase
MNLDLYRNSEREQQRIHSLLALVPQGRTTVLDVGARDGYISRRLSERFARVTALDLEQPRFIIEGVTALKGDVTSLDFQDESFDTVLCAEVLEHVPPARLQRACKRTRPRHEV